MARTGLISSNPARVGFRRSLLQAACAGNGTYGCHFVESHCVESDHCDDSGARDHEERRAASNMTVRRMKPPPLGITLRHLFDGVQSTINVQHLADKRGQ